MKTKYVQQATAGDKKGRNNDMVKLFDWMCENLIAEDPEKIKKDFQIKGMVTAQHLVGIARKHGIDLFMRVRYTDEDLDKEADLNAPPADQGSDESTEERELVEKSPEGDLTEDNFLDNLD